MGFTSNTVLVEIANRVATVLLNRPEKLNALDEEMMESLPTAIADVAADRDVGCVVITGAGRAFCAGGDIAAMAAREISGERRALDQVRQRQEASRLLHEMPKPTIAMINGTAVGAGLSIAISCDMRLASTTARFSAGFIRMALSGDYGGTWLMQHLIGSARARELYFTGDFIDADEAKGIGLVNRVLPDERLATETSTLAERLAQGPALALARMKQNMNLALTSDFQALLEVEAQGIMTTGDSADHKEAVRAFMDKRPPTFRHD